MKPQRRFGLFITKALGWIAIIIVAAMLGFLIVGLFSCTDTCKDCTTTMYINGKVQSTSVQNLCGDDWETMDGHIVTTKQGSITVISKTYCK